MLNSPDKNQIFKFLFNLWETKGTIWLKLTYVKQSYRLLFPWNVLYSHYISMLWLFVGIVSKKRFQCMLQHTH